MPDNSNANSFPSGHTSTTFHSATFLYKRYGWRLGVPAFLIAGFTGFSRIQAKKHDGWDVIGGASIGIISGLLFTKVKEKKHLDFSFSHGNEGYLIGLSYKF